jgi:hypothetical protein
VYQFKEEINYTSHFWFDKLWIKNLNWKMLPKAAKAIYPVIALHRSPEGIAFPGEQTIAILSGLTEKSVRVGIEALYDFPGITIEPYVTGRGRRSKRFIFETIRREKGRHFPFHKSIIEGGNWSLLKPTSQAIYPVMRYYGFFNINSYQEQYPDSFESPEDFNDDFANRECDFCEAEPKLITEMAGISYRSYREDLKDLQKHFLIEEMDDSTLKVFLHPPRYYPREDLNREILRKYKKSLLRVEEKNTGYG